MELSKKDIDFLVSILKKYIDTSLATITNRSRIKVHHFEEQYMRTVNGGLPLDQSLFRTYLQTCGKVNVWIDLDKTGVFPEEKDSDVLYFIWQDDGYNMYIYTDKYVLVTSGSDKSYIDDENKSLDTTYSSDKVEELISALAQESDPVFNQWLLDNSAYLNALLVEQPPLPTTKYLNGERQWVALPSVGDIEHDDTLNKNGNPDFLHITQAEKDDFAIKAYAYERVNVAPTIALKLATQTAIVQTLTSANTFAITLPTPRLNKINESIITFKIGSTVPNITYPANLKWYTDEIVLRINSTRTLVFEQKTFDGVNFETWVSCDKNV